MLKQRVLTVDHISFAVPNCEKIIVDGVTFTANKNDFIVLLGSNGSGKSSLLNLIDRTCVPTKGKIAFLDDPLNKYRKKTLAKKRLNRPTSGPSKN